MHGSRRRAPVQPGASRRQALATLSVPQLAAVCLGMVLFLVGMGLFLIARHAPHDSSAVLGSESPLTLPGALQLQPDEADASHGTTTASGGSRGSLASDASAPLHGALRGGGGPVSGSGAGTDAPLVDRYQQARQQIQHSLPRTPQPNELVHRLDSQVFHRQQQQQPSPGEPSSSKPSPSDTSPSDTSPSDASPSCDVLRRAIPPAPGPKAPPQLIQATADAVAAVDACCDAKSQAGSSGFAGGFRCADGSGQTVACSRIGDGFADCADASDEPLLRDGGGYRCRAGAAVSWLQASTARGHASAPLGRQWREAMLSGVVPVLWVGDGVCDCQGCDDEDEALLQAAGLR